jgi:hypothetical protein
VSANGNAREQQRHASTGLYVRAQPGLTLRHKKVGRLGPKMCATRRRNAREVLRETEIERPIQSDADLLLYPREVAQIDRPPQQPKKPEKFNSRMLATPV